MEILGWEREGGVGAGCGWLGVGPNLGPGPGLRSPSNLIF